MFFFLFRKGIRLTAVDIMTYIKCYLSIYKLNLSRNACLKRLSKLLSIETKKYYILRLGPIRFQNNRRQVDGADWRKRIRNKSNGCAVVARVQNNLCRNFVS